MKEMCVVNHILAVYDIKDIYIKYERPLNRILILIFIGNGISERLAYIFKCDGKRYCRVRWWGIFFEIYLLRSFGDIYYAYVYKYALCVKWHFINDRVQHLYLIIPHIFICILIESFIHIYLINIYTYKLDQRIILDQKNNLNRQNCLYWKYIIENI